MKLIFIDIEYKRNEEEEKEKTIFYIYYSLLMYFVYYIFYVFNSTNQVLFPPVFTSQSFTFVFNSFIFFSNIFEQKKKTNFVN